MFKAGMLPRREFFFQLKIKDSLISFYLIDGFLVTGLGVITNPFVCPKFCVFFSFSNGQLMTICREIPFAADSRTVYPAIQIHDGKLQYLKLRSPNPTSKTAVVKAPHRK